MTDAAHTTDTLFDQLTDAIDQNGTLTEAQRKKLMLMTIKEVYHNTLCIPDISKRVEKLEAKSIWMWAERHPKGAVTVVLAFVMLVTAWGEVSPQVLQLLGF
jgi:hypothetical protein